MFPTKGPIAMLQEFVQSSKDFPLPPNYSALRWSFDTRVASKAALEHRAVVNFVLEGVPHLAAGTWQPSKKLSQRDAADRALGFFVGRWGARLLQHEEEGGDDDSAVSSHELGSQMLHHAGNAEVFLEKVCQTYLQECGGSSPKWTLHRAAYGLFFCVVELDILGVPHKLAGGHCDTEQAARWDAAKRVLWYLQCPGFEDLYQAQPLSSSQGGLEGSTLPQDDWICDDDSSTEAVEEAKRKTMAMRVQNRLQQKFARLLSPGQSVWEWSYEADPNDGEWPPLFKAIVAVPVANKKFVGEWTRGQREAQFDAINKVIQYLDANEASSQERPKR